MFALNVVRCSAIKIVNEAHLSTVKMAKKWPTLYGFGRFEFFFFVRIVVYHRIIGIAQAILVFANCCERRECGGRIVCNTF